MGGSETLIASFFTQVVSSAIGASQNQARSPDTSAQLAAERKAKEDELAKKEADERRRKRGKVVEARELEKKRLKPAANKQTTLANGGAGLINDPEVTSTGLKTKLGE